MGNRYYAVSGTGMFFSEDEVGVLLKGYANAHPEENMDYVPVELVSSNGDGTFVLEDYTENTAIMTYFEPCKETSDSFEDFGYIIWAAKSTTAERILSGNSYTSIQEIISEMKDLVEKYLPEDFDYEAHIGNISSASFG